MNSIVKTKGFTYFIESLWYNNATFSMVLGICSALAVTTNLVNAFVMGVSVTVVLTISSTIVAVMRGIIPERVRLITFMLIISTFVIVVDFVLKVYFTSISATLGPYVGLIITNCILMGRAEAFAVKHPPWHSFLDSAGSGLGYTGSIMVIAGIRELFGAGSLFGVPVLGPSWVGMGLLLIPSGAFFVLGFYIMAANIMKNRFVNRGRS